MASVADPLLLADEITSNLRSAATTTTQTLKSLRHLLGQFEHERTGPYSSTSEASSKKDAHDRKTKAAPKRHAKNAKSTASLEFVIFESENCIQKPLTSARKRKLATEAFNVSLKCLAENVKRRQDVEHNGGSRPEKTVARGTTSKSLPLQPCSPNRRTKPNRLDCSTPQPAEDLNSVADCAITSLDCLRQFGEQEQRANAGDEQKLDQGALAVVEKLISLNMLEKSTIELSKIYEQYWKRRKNNKNKQPAELQVFRNKLDISIHLCPVTEREDRQTLSFVTSYQSQVLRLLILLGSQAVTENVVACLSLDYNGSPANIILKGYELGLLGKEKASQQLRTAAQALIKLYSISITDKKTCKEKSALNFSLLRKALSIKCRSWNLSCHEVDLDREYWGLILKGLKRWDSNYETSDNSTLESYIQHIHQASNVLQQDGFENTIPIEMVYMVMDIADNRGCSQDTVAFVLEHFQQARTLTEEARAIIAWRIASMKCRSSSARDQHLLGCLEHASASFDKLSPASVDDLDAVCLHSARLRKASLTIFLAAKRSSEDCHKSNEDASIRLQCVEIVSKLLDLQSSLIELGEVSSPIQTGFAKTFEAMLEICKSYLKHPSFIPQKYALSLERGMRTSNLLMGLEDISTKSDQVGRFIQNLVIQVSHLYWMRYLDRCDESTPIENKHLLEQSCHVVRKLSTEMQRSASFVTKLEKLALVHLALSDQDAARECFSTAVAYHIAVGALDEAVSTALSQPSYVTWSKRGSKSYLLGKALQSHAQICLTYGLTTHSDGDWIYDEQKLAPTHRIALLEAQVVAAVDHDFTDEQLDALTKHVLKLLDVSKGPQLPVYALRFIGNLLHLHSKNQTASLDNVFESDHVQNLLKTTVPAGSDLPLASYASSTHHQVNIQYLMLHGCQNVSELEKHVSSLCPIICSAPDASALEASIDNIDFLTKQLQTLVSYARSVANTKISISCLKSLRHILRLIPMNTSTQLVEMLTQLASLYHQTGDISEAGKTFSEAEKLLVQGVEETPVVGRWTFAYVQYLADISNKKQALEVFSKAISRLEARQISSEKLSGKKRLENDSMIGLAAYVASTLALQLGQLEQASLLARQSVKLSTAIWQAIDKPSGSANELKPGSDSETTLSVLTEEMSNLTLLSDQSVKQSKPQGGSYWTFVDLHCSALGHMTELSMYHGLYQDAVYYAEQLRKVSFAVNSSYRRMRAMTLLALVHAKAGHQLEATQCLESLVWADQDLNMIENRLSALQCAEALVEIENFDQASIILDAVEAHRTFITKPAPIEQPTKTGIKKAPVRGKTKVVRPTRLAPKRPGQQSVIESEKSETAEAEKDQTQSQIHQSEKCFVLRNRITLRSKDVQSGFSPPEKAKTITGTSVDGAVTTAMTMLQRALHEFSSDSVNCVLSETAVALPVRYKSARKSGRISFTQATESLAMVKVPKSVKNRNTASKPLAVESALSTGEKLVMDAQKLLRGIQNGGSGCSSDVLHLAHKLQSRLALLSSAVNVPCAVSSLEMFLQSLKPKDLIQNRHQLSIKAERATKDKTQILAWPDVTSLQETDAEYGNFDCTMDDLSDLPQTWSLVSLSLAENQQEIIMSKIVSNRSPFVLRIPLSRSDVEIDEDTNFTFAEAKEELLDIVANANASAHDKRGQGNKEARREWYAEREVLDQRLEAWSNNIESIWLGGFRGLMSSDHFDDDVTTGFGQNLNRILDKHLPSRQKASKTAKDKVVLHAHVLELFLGLGNPEEQEIDDAVTDLLYFVVDILQFNGERNAYDEIDFDAILVDVLDELRSCHDVTRQGQSDGPRHTILIVDKEMASFPWESLPCLKDQAVSRMPSLSSVIQRLKKIRSVCSAAEGHCISGKQGSYMLNSSGDLKSTQTTFEPILQSQLPDFDGTIGKPPTESEFSSALTSNELFLYFGHGSGAQYIRGRTIRSLDKCAVTLLMGCSSGKMNECGKFESYGMPDYYIGGLSGCMAVVGTLWDVTDRDIDRFALKTMVEWGLLEEDDNVVRAMRKSSKKPTQGGKGQVDTSHVEEGRALSLDEAVNRGRDACLLRYLNGAAPVVYGIPVFLS